MTGPELAGKFEEHARKYKFPIKENEGIIAIEKADGIITVKTEKAIYKASTLLLATGKRSRELNVPGEKELKNRGVAYCATCDGPLFAGKDVAIIGGGNSALDAALQMVKISKQVYLVNNTLELAGDSVMLSKLKEAPNVTVFNSSRVEKITGSSFVTGITIDTKGVKKEISLQGIFVEIGLLPNSEFAGPVKKNINNEILVNNSCETDVPGIFAAGDVTNVPEKQIIIAAGEGAKAALSVFKYLNTHK